LTAGGGIPVLATERLRLRSFRESDLEFQAAALADPEVVRHLGGAPFAREDSWRRMLAGPGLWAMLGYGYWAVERLQDGLYLGQVGFADFKRDITPSLEGLPEMGWIFAPHGQGQGYAAEAVAAALAWADQSLAHEQIVAIIAPENTPSIRLALKAGFREAEHTTYKGDPTLIFRR
jgi:RimJ/RimL family protein N-acetyltransferase